MFNRVRRSIIARQKRNTIDPPTELEECQSERVLLLSLRSFVGRGCRGRLVHASVTFLDSFYGRLCRCFGCFRNLVRQKREETLHVTDRRGWFRGRLRATRK